MAGNRWKGVMACTVDGCGHARQGAGLCSLHYQRSRRGTNLDAERRGRGANTILRADDGTLSLRLAGRFSTMAVALDDVDLALVGPFRWFGDARGRTVYAVASDYDRKRIYMHRLVISAPRGLEGDHINGNGLDNRRANLRLVTRAEQNQNLSARGRTGVRGVTYSPRAGSKARPFCVRVQVLGKITWGGHFATLAEAESVAVSIRASLMPFAVER